MITAIILAAGQSKRMGKPKMLLPWGKLAVLEQVIATFKSAGVEDILVVTGADREKIETLVNNSARTVFNPNFIRGEMLSSIQAGLADTAPGIHAALIALGDQPQIRAIDVQLVVEAYYASRASIIIPSFKMRRGHPWLADRSHWDEIRGMHAPESMRDFLNRHADVVHYVPVDNDTILQDLDTPEDYLKSKP